MNNQFSPEIQKMIFQYIDVFFRRRYWIFFPIIVALGVSLGLSYWLPKAYRSTTMILVEPQIIPQDYVKSTVTTPISERLKTISQQVMSRTNLIKLRDELDLFPKEFAELGKESVVEKLQKNIQLDVVGKQAFSISFVGKDPEKVMNVTNRIASRFIEENLKVREQQAQVTTNFLQKELAEAKKQMDSLDENIRRFKEKNRGGLPSEIDSNLRTLDRLQINFQANRDLINSKEDRAQDLENQILKLKQEALNFTTNSASSIEEPNMPLQQLREKLKNLRIVYKENYPDVILLKKQIREMEAQLSQSTTKSNPTGDIPFLRENENYKRLLDQHQKILREIKDLEVTGKLLVEKIRGYETRVARTPMLEVELKKLQRDYDMSQGNYQNLLGKSINARLSENLEKRQQGERFRIIDPANLPEKPYKPNLRKLLLAGSFAGAASGFGLALLIEMLNPCFRQPEDLEGVMKGPLVVSIPKFSKYKKIKFRPIKEKKEGQKKFLNPKLFKE
ncbi:MAG TPA: GNVR domain-containing protein [Nitrospiria bacterium]|jgi:polysaccharide chain length determinant protein (PEP-CTERM system associated)